MEADNIRSPWYKGYHLGRFIYQELLDERQSRAENLERCRRELGLIEEQIAQGRPVVGSLETAIDGDVDRLMLAFGSSDEKPDWKKEGF